MPVRCQIYLIAEDGSQIKVKKHLKYLGAQIAGDGTMISELAQKISIAESDFKVLKQIWSHSNLSKQFKAEIFSVCIIQKLLYALEGAWINKIDQRRLDAFQNRCLRRILGIAPAFVNHITNASVL